MNFAFFGTPTFAKQVLQGLVELGWTPCVILTQPEIEPVAKRPNRLTLGSDLATWARRSLVHIPLLQPQKASGEQSIADLHRYRLDAILVAAYGQLLRPNLLQLPTFGCLNAHTSLLPKWRGAAPVQRAILAGDQMTGLTLMKMAKGLDTGDLIQQVPVKIGPDMTCGQLEEILAARAAHLFSWALTELKAGRSLPFKAQEDQGATYAPKFDKQEGLITWTESAIATHRRIRAASPHPGAWCRVSYRGRIKRLKLAASCLLSSNTHVESSHGLFGFGSSYLLVKLEDAYLAIGQVQLEGKRWMGAREFWSGYSKFVDDFN